jgi:hypothetical protein
MKHFAKTPLDRCGQYEFVNGGLKGEGERKRASAEILRRRMRTDWLTKPKYSEKMGIGLNILGIPLIELYNKLRAPELWFDML